MVKKSDNQQNRVISEIKRVEKSLRAEMLRVEERLENKIDKTKDDLIGKIDSFAGRVETLETENAIGTDQTRELRVQVDDHEQRISKLEPTVP